mmetsp:Transcript_53484/g.130671  ORF Transcript_53484/g.130671 Transcript_53484/m.130671 type:complete len:512 (+) Transcript_53484:56-1591(+)
MVEDAAASITVKVLKADGVRLNYSGEKPTVLAQLRINVGGRGEQAFRTTPANASISPEWNQQFVLPVRDPQTSQLECTLWDDSDSNAKNHSNFLGEVILNLAKLVPYKGQYIEQVFDIKQGKTIKTEKQASGKLKMGLQLDSPPVQPAGVSPRADAAPVGAGAPAPPPPEASPVRAPPKPAPAPAPPPPHSPVRASPPAQSSPQENKIGGASRTPTRTGPLPGGGPADVGLILGPGVNNCAAAQQLIPGGPASSSGQIKQGDLLIDVDGFDVVGRGVPEVQNMLRGERNSPVTMIFRRGAEQVVVTLLRAVPVQPGAPAAPTQTRATATSTPVQVNVPPARPLDQGLPADQLNALKREYGSLSFLWGEGITDSTVNSMTDWKKSVLYGPKRDINDTQEVDDRSALSVSYRGNAGRTYTPVLGPQSAALPYNPPMYRSFDQGSVNMYGSRNAPYAVSNSRISDPVMRVQPQVHYRGAEGSQVLGGSILGGSINASTYVSGGARPANDRGVIA